MNWRGSEKDNEKPVIQGPQLYYSKRESETNPNHPEFSSTVGGRKLNLTPSQHDSYIREAEYLIHSLYPKVRHNISYKHVLEPHFGGALISNQTNKFAAELSVKTEINVRAFLFMLSLAIINFSLESVPHRK